ncbi:MAG: cell division inhibitor SepF [Candidatus Poriferisodalaceae bacterium]|jgi:cell division inhibitor SepF
MASLWRKSMLYLGLGPDENYDQISHEGHDDGNVDGNVDGRIEPVHSSPEPGPAAALSRSGRSGMASASSGMGAMGGSSEGLKAAGAVTTSTITVRPIAERPAADSGPRPGEGIVSVSPMKPTGSTGSVRTIPVSSTKPHIVSPRSFNDAQQVADRFKADQPIIVNLQAVDRELSRRLIDFTSGLCYALEGNMEKVADNVYLLSPSNVRVPDEERRRLQERGLHS